MKRTLLASWPAAIACAAIGLGSLAAAYLFKPEIPPPPPADPDLQRNLAALKEATPERANALESKRTGIARTLPTPTALESRVSDLDRDWNIRRENTEALGPIELRRYTLTPRDPVIDAWPKIITSIATLCELRGISLDRVELILDSSGERFERAEIAFVARLQR